MKKIIIISTWIILVTVFVFLIIYINKKRQDVKLVRVDIVLNHNNAKDFVTRNDIKNIIDDSKLIIQNVKFSEINHKKIEDKILENPFIASVDVYSTNDGVLKICVIQRQPIVRVINKIGQNFYLDEEAKMIPLSDKYAPRLIIAHGNITNVYSPGFRLINFDKKILIDTNKLTDLQKLYFLSKYINKSDFWKAMIDQIYYMPNGDIELFLTLGNQGVILGGIDNLDEKFQKLLLFYKKEISKVGWGKYKTINLKYKEQIVCTK